MALYTKLNDQTIRQITAPFGIGEIKSWKILHGGSENTNHHVHTDKGQFVLTICERKTVEETAILAALLQHLEKHQFETTLILPNAKGELISSYQGKPILLKSFIEGQVQEEIGNELLLKIGQSMAQLHTIPVPEFVPKQYGYGLEVFEQLAEQKITHPFVDWLAVFHQYIKNSLHPDLPKALIHGDIFASNVVIFQNDQPIIMDFEEACYYYRTFDIGMAVVGLCKDKGLINWEKANCLLKGYQEIMPLLSMERNVLKNFVVYAATATAFWRFRQFNIIAPMDAYKDTYQEMVTIAEQAKNTEWPFFSQ